MIKPIFKWMGGKRKMMPLYAPLLNVEPEEVTHFYDLFAGSLAASLWAYDAYPNATIHINEYNPFLVGLYKCIASQPERFVAALYNNVSKFLAIPEERELDKKGHRHLRKRYAWYRESLETLHEMWRREGDTPEFYGLQYLLQRVSFGGAWQTNKRLAPTYATPSGSLTATSKTLYNRYDILGMSAFLRSPRVSMTCDSYENVFIVPDPGVVVFADPPYINTVQKYDAPFSVDNQRELCDHLNHLHDQGHKVMMTNAPWSEWSQLLPGFKIWSKDHTYTTGQDVKASQELLISNFLK